MSREIPSNIIDNLLAKKYTLAKLQQMDNSELTDLGLNIDHINAIKDGSRPEIEDSILNQVLSEARFTCCICHQADLPFAIHHLKEWADGGKHVEENLVLLCLHHHDAAHLKGGLSQRLDKDKIKEAKANWKKIVEEIDRNQWSRMRTELHRDVHWHWLHFERLQKISTLGQIRLGPNRLTEVIERLKHNLIIDAHGNITSPDGWKVTNHGNSHLFDFRDGRDVAIYLSDLALEVIDRLAVLDISDMLDKPAALKKYVEEGDYIFVRENFDISVDKSHGKNATETNLRFARAQEGKTVIELYFDSYTSLNATSKGTHLFDEAKRSIVGSVTKCNEVNGKIKILLSPLGISSSFLLRHPSHGIWVQGQDPSEA
ncbi:HNH endonuclease [Burkholderia gladioli]|uniref:HNH endonuclease n=2 Tax=Burkholderia gladioli TaxID=28095 RepID=UPI0016416EC4|nr:HNH endonuclease signature motif containing protein [Burkholderia gladioli]MDN7726653.1 HNH endonuclease signature motif containing protein [Burkholderia gladioli]